MEARLKNPYLLLALGLLLLSLVEFGGTSLLRTAEHRFSDLLLRFHATTQQPDPDIVIIDIDEHSLDAMAPIAGRFPWPRAIHAELVEAIAAQQPQAIVFDILFIDPDLNDPEGDAYLVDVAKTTDNLFFPLLRLSKKSDDAGLSLDEHGEQLGFSRNADAQPGTRAALLLPLRPLAETGRIGAINFVEDGDGVGRRYGIYVPIQGWRIPSLPARVAGSLGYPLPDSETIILNWRGGALSYPRIPYADLYNDIGRRDRQRSVDELNNKIVIIGSSASGEHDLRVTPISNQHPAFELIATAIDNLKHGDHLQRAPSWFAPLLTLLLLGWLLLTFLRGINPLHSGAALLLATPLLGAGAYLALGWQLLLPVLAPTLFAWSYYALAAGYAFWQEHQERVRSIAIFSRFLDPRVVDELVRKGETVPGIKVESRQITVLFSDIRGFTTLSEQRTAEQVVELLNDYFSRQVKVIFSRHGTMDKFIGDAIMAFWGAPVSDEQQAIHAVEAALDMTDALLEFRNALEGDLADFDIGIGIHTGLAVVGFIGSENRLDYTAIGDTVNLASRIEGQTKGRARTLVSAETRALCGDTFDFIDHGFYKVKGRHQEVQLFEPRRKR